MQITLRINATADEKFTPTSFDSNLGKTLPVLNGKEGKIIKVEVVENGKAALVTVEIEGDGKLLLDGL